MAKVTRTTTINAPVEKTFGFAKDIGQLWSSWPDVDVRDVTVTPDGVGSSAHWSTGKWGIHVIGGRIDYTQVVPDQRIIAESSTGPVFTFTFEPKENATVLTVDCEWHTEVPVVGGPIDDFLEKWTERDLEAWLVRIKAKVEGVTPATESEPAGSLTRAITINAPAEKVFGFVADLGRLWSYFPDTAVREVNLTAAGVGSSVRLYSHWRGLHMEGAVEVTEVVRSERLVMKASFVGEHPTWTFTFAPEGDATRLTVLGEWRVDVPGVGPRIGALMAKEHQSGLEEMLAGIKAHAEAD